MLCAVTYHWGIPVFTAILAFFQTIKFLALIFKLGQKLLWFSEELFQPGPINTSLNYETNTSLYLHERLARGAKLDCWGLAEQGTNIAATISKRGIKRILKSGLANIETLIFSNAFRWRMDVVNWSAICCRLYFFVRNVSFFQVLSIKIGTVYLYLNKEKVSSF